MALKQAVDHQVSKGNADGYGDSGKRPAAAHGECKWNGQHRHDDGDQRIGEFVPKRDAQPHGVKAALAQIADVIIELAEVHFLRLHIFFCEVARVFVNLRERGLAELAVGSRFRSGHIPHPAVLKTPRAAICVPKYARGEDAPCEGEGGRIEFEDRQISELLWSGS